MITMDKVCLNSQICGNTIPHAGFEYSGLIGLFSIADLFYNSQYDTNEITILWFKHSIYTEYEHSLKNVCDLCYLLFPGIKINNIYIDSSSKIENLEIRAPVLVSTDFSHHNYCISQKNLYEVWKNDSKSFNLDIRKDFKTIEDTPCGNEPLRIYKEWIKKNKYQISLNGYSNSTDKDNWWKSFDNVKFSGVTYAVLSTIEEFNNSWFSNLQSKLLAYSHLKWVEDYLLDIEIENNGLIWSPLNNKVGSCFISISDSNNNIISCFGSWENNNNSLLEIMKKATNLVKKYSWNNNPPLSKNILEKYRNFIITINLIEPIHRWKKIHNNIIEKNRGYVFYKPNENKIGMTFIPSVWENIKDEQEFYTHLINKHKNVYNDISEWDLFMYESISWSRNI